MARSLKESSQSSTRGLKEVPFTCGKHIKEYITTITGAELPEILMSTFIPDNITWIFKQDNELSRISLVGKDWSQMDGIYENAKTILEVIRKAEVNKDGHEIYTPTVLKIASVNEKQGVVVAGAWDFENENRLIEVNASISNSEIDNISNKTNCLMEMIMPINHSPNYPHSAAGLVTPQMCETISREDQGSKHKHVFVFKLRSESTSEPIVSSVFHNTTVADEFSRLGYYIKREAGASNIIKFGLKTTFAKNRHVNPFEFSFPEALPIAQ